MFFAALCVSLFVKALNDLRVALVLKDTPTSKIRSASQGYVELDGHAEVPGDTPIVSPLSGMECVWWRYKIERSVSSEGEKKWKIHSSNESLEPFLLVDSTGKCLVHPKGAKVVHYKEAVWYGDTPHRPKLGTARVFNSTNSAYRFSETMIFKNERLYACGMFKTSGGDNDATTRAQTVRKLLGRWKRDAEKMREFDTNDDGTVDMGEWDVARQMAVDTADCERMQRGVSAVKHMLVDPKSRSRPYLLSSKCQEKVVSKLQWGVIGNLCFSLLAGVGAYLFYKMAVSY